MVSILATLWGGATAAVAGPFGKMIAAGTAAVVAVLGIAWGIHDIKADARLAERAEWVTAVAQGQLEAAQSLSKRIAASEQIAAEQREAMTRELLAAQQRSQDLEAALAKAKPSVAYPVAIAKRLAQ